MSPWSEYVLQVLVELCDKPSRPVAAGFVADHLGIARRTAYNYLRELEQYGKVVRPSPRRWCVA